MAKFTYVPPAPPLSAQPLSQRRHLLRCFHQQLADAHQELAAALRRIDGVRNFAVRNGMHDHAEQILETHTRAGYQAYLLSEFLRAQRIAAEIGDPESPPSKRRAKGKLQ